MKSQRAEATPIYLDAKSVKLMTNRLARAEGTLGGIRKMIDNRRCIDEILIQVAAVKGALNRFASELLEHQLRTCVSQCKPAEQQKRLQQIADALAVVFKQS